MFPIIFLKNPPSKLILSKGKLPISTLSELCYNENNSGGIKTEGVGNMERIVDKPYFTYSVYTALSLRLNVKCPKCHGFGIVTANKDTAFFRCTNCGHIEEKGRTIFRYDVHNQCKCCGRYYRADIQDEGRQHFQVLHVACPFCKTVMR